MSDNHTTLLAGSPLGAPGEHGLARLARARRRRLEHGAARAARKRTGRTGAALAFVAALGPSAGPEARALAARAGVSLPLAAESLAIASLPASGGAPATVLLAGGDERGPDLRPARGRAPDRTRCPPPGRRGRRRVLALFPASSRGAASAACAASASSRTTPSWSAEWYRSPDFWEWYFDLLALHRFNRFTLTFGHQTAYLSPPYPFFVDVPEHPEVRATGLTPPARDANLELLRGIARMATERGLELRRSGVWSAARPHVRRRDGRTGWTTDNLVPYCAAGLRRMLEAVPEICAVQLRVNAESGHPPGRRGGVLARALRGRRAPAAARSRLDLRAKAIVDDTIEAGLETGLPVTVDTKFWTEHQGLPYHATLLQDGDRYVRAPQLRRPAALPGRRAPTYDFLFQLWNLGTNKLPAVGRSGVGAGASPQQHSRRRRRLRGLRTRSRTRASATAAAYWRIFADSAFTTTTAGSRSATGPGTSLFGRLGYSGDADPDTPGTGSGPPGSALTAAPHAERALQRASGVLPLLTARHSPSASVFGYWPEMDTGGLLDLYLQVPGSDVGMFASAEEAVAERLAGRPGARQTPPQSSALFERMADEAEAAIAAAQAAATPADERAARELRAVALDVRVQAALARYHAAEAARRPPRWPPTTPAATWIRSSPPGPTPPPPSPPGSRSWP